MSGVSLSESLVSWGQGSHYHAETFDDCKPRISMLCSPFCDLVRADTASTAPSSRCSNSESPLDAVSDGAKSAADYDESWPCLPQNHPRLWKHNDCEALPGSFQQSPLVHRPQPKKLSTPARLPTLEPMQVDVPFLVNYQDTLLYGPQRLPTIMEWEDEDEDEMDDNTVDEEYRDSSQPPPVETAQDTESEYPLEPASYRYSYVDCYQDHRWDLGRSDAVLSEAIYYHVLQATRPTLTPELAPMPVPVESPEVFNLVKPQALRVVCPTTIAPVVRQDESEPASGGPKDSMNWYRTYLEESQIGGPWVQEEEQRCLYD